MIDKLTQWTKLSVWWTMRFCIQLWISQRHDINVTCVTVFLLRITIAAFTELQPSPVSPIWTDPRHLISAPTEKWPVASASLEVRCQFQRVGIEKNPGRRDAVRDTTSPATTSAHGNVDGTYSRGYPFCRISGVSSGNKRIPGLPF